MSPKGLYDEMAPQHHLVFQDWDRSIAYQGGILAKLLPPPDRCGIVLDCACGIGTQSIALGLRGFHVEGSDLSAAAVERAAEEARSRGLSIPFRQDDMCSLGSSPGDHFGCVLAFDNSLSHLDSDSDVSRALRAMHGCLQNGGLLLLSVRNYDDHIARKTKFTEPVIYDNHGLRRIVHQVWDWKDERCYTVHIFITVETHAGQWTNHHAVGECRAITAEEVARLAREAGFEDVEVIDTTSTGFYQPIIRARKVT